MSVKNNNQMRLVDITPRENNKNTFGERLKELIGKRSGRSFAKELAISYSTLHNYLTEVSQPTLENLVRISKHTGTTVDWLATGLLPKYKKDQALYKTDENDYRDIDDYRGIKLQINEPYANYHSHKTAKLELAWLQSRGINAEECAIFTMSGDSMEPTIKDGDEIIINRGNTTLKEGKIVAFNTMGNILVRKVKIGLNSIELISDNEHYQPIVLNKDKLYQIQIIGQVVRCYRDL